MCNGKVNHMVQSFDWTTRRAEQSVFSCTFSCNAIRSNCYSWKKGHRLPQITQNHLQTHGQRDKIQRGSRQYQVGVTLKPQLRAVWTGPSSLNPPLRSSLEMYWGGYLFLFFPCVWETDKKTPTVSKLKWAAQERRAYFSFQRSDTSPLRTVRFPRAQQIKRVIPSEQTATALP